MKIEKRRIVSRILSSLLSMILITCFLGEPVFCDQPVDVRESTVSGTSETVETSEAWEETSADNSQSDCFEIIVEQDPGETDANGEYWSAEKTEGSWTFESPEETAGTEGTGTPAAVEEGTGAFGSAGETEGTGTPESSEETGGTEGSGASESPEETGGIEGTEGTGTPESSEETGETEGTGTPAAVEEGAGASGSAGETEGSWTFESPEETTGTEGTGTPAAAGEEEEAGTSGSAGETYETGTPAAAGEEEETGTSASVEEPGSGEFIEAVEESDAGGATDTDSSGINDADAAANENGPDYREGSEEAAEASAVEFPVVETEPEEEEISVPASGAVEDGNAGPEGVVIENGLLVDYGGNEEEVFIPADVTGIGKSAFLQCTGLKRVTIPESVTSIGDNAFMGCSGLESVTFEGIALTFGKDVFNGCSNLKIYCRPGAASIIDYAKQYSIHYETFIREPVTEIIINSSEAVVYTGKTKTLKAAVKPDSADLKTVTWKSSNTKVATVTSKGEVKGVARGTATVTAAAKDGSGTKATCRITVKQSVRKLTMSRKTAAIKKGGKVTLKVTAAPENADNKAVKWTTSNKKIATVTSKGVVRGVAKGTATITATAKDGSGAKATCRITVKQPVRKLTLSRETAVIKEDGKVTLKVTAAPKNANNKAVKWTTSDKKIAAVTSKGEVRGVAEGTAVITAAAKDGSGIKASCKVTVKKKTNPEKNTIRVDGSNITIGQYANFRNVCAGAMAPNVLYRCINPIIPYSSKQKKPAYYADRLLEENDVITVINLSDTLEEMKSKGYSEAVYYKKLLNKGTVYSRKLQDNGNYTSVDKKRAIADVVRVIAQNQGPYAVHCRWGQGRTGVVIMLLESLMGADYDYLYNDFVTTFRNFNQVGKYTGKSTYNREFSKYMASITGIKASNPEKPQAWDWRKTDLAACAKKYLKDGGMTDAEIRVLKERLSGFF